MRYGVKKIINKLTQMENPAISEQEFSNFFKHPCWLAIRKGVGEWMDDATDVIFKGSDINKVNEARGVMKGLMFIFEGENKLRQLITDNADALEASPTVEKRLAAILSLVDSELQEKR
jgi:hypothetical protein